MYDDGQGARHDFCIVCYKQKAELVTTDAYMVMGNRDTQHINSFGYCMEHLSKMVLEFHRRTLCLKFFKGNDERTETVNEALVTMRESKYAYFL